jgi:hypothetical protein
MDAWIDCMTSLDVETDGLSSIHVQPGAVLCLEVADAAILKAHDRDLYDAIVECAAFVNWRRVERGRPAVLALSFHV